MARGMAAPGPFGPGDLGPYSAAMLWGATSAG